MALPLAVAEAGAGVEEEVRRLVARELHDRVAQTLTGMLVEVENFKSAEVDWHEVVQQLDLIQTSTRQVLASIRQLLHDLRGEDTLEGRFVDVVRAAVMRFELRTAIATKVEVGDGWPQSMNSAASLNLFRIIEEALANVRMHSGARNVSIVLEARSDNEVALTVSDDGRGVDTDPLRPAGLGTIGMRERALFLGGRLWIESENGGGATVRAVFPKALLAAEPSPLPETITLEAQSYK
ncbi:MAG TPA: ATP-binding protein [Candidatus Dormibacteraeota bacterium]|nr:ATP-binding protein [Candidatus Dormibacteraeota bacterium]